MIGAGESNQIDQPIAPDIVVTPEPSEAELAAIVAAITTLSQAHRSGDRPDTAPARMGSRWATAGRREAMRGLAQDDERR